MIVRVALPLPLAKTFSYAVPDRWSHCLAPYVRVRVPFHNKTGMGYIIGTEDGEARELKEIVEVIDPFPVIHHELIELCQWGARHYVTPMGLVLKCAIPPKFPFEKHITVKRRDPAVAVTDGTPLKKVLKTFDRGELFRLVQNGAIELCDKYAGEPFRQLEVSATGKEGEKPVFYQGGVTGRIGYYVDRIDEVLEGNGNVLFLLPDHQVAGHYFEKNLAERFPGKLFWYGSSVKESQSAEAFMRARACGGTIFLGNKSAVFLPVRDLSLIIVERYEEDEYRNEEGFRYNAVVLAMKRAAIEAVPVVIGSVAPTVDAWKDLREDRFKVVRGAMPRKYTTVTIQLEREIGPGVPVPQVLFDAIQERMNADGDIAVFTPRKDYGIRVHCLACKKPFKCPRCGAPLSFQKRKKSLICASCARRYDYNEVCSHCGGQLITFAYTGAEFLADEVGKAFPDGEVLLVTGDTVHDRLRERPLPDHCRGKRIIIGTQVLSKCYEMSATSILFIGWEELLRISGFRAEEKTFQIIGNLVDALNPEEIVFFNDVKRGFTGLSYLDTGQFYEKELIKREITGFPPYRRLFLIEFERTHEKTGEKMVAAIKNVFEEKGLGQSISGPFVSRRNKISWKMIAKDASDELVEVLIQVQKIGEMKVVADPIML